MGAEMERNPNLSGLIKASPLDLGLSSPKKRVRQSWISQKRVIPRPLIYGSVLFALGLMSLLTGHIVSDMEWAKFRQYRRELQKLFFTSFAAILVFRAFYDLILIPKFHSFED